MSILLNNHHLEIKYVTITLSQNTVFDLDL